MRAPNKKAAAQGGAKGSGHRGSSSEKKNTQPALQSQGRIQSWADVDLRGERLAIVAAWRDELRLRIARETLRFELANSEIDLKPLEAEVTDFRRCCRALMWRPAA